jgi:hypothetical protein
MSLCLTAAEVREVTGKTWHAQQCEALAAMGIRFTVQAQSGRPLVDRRDWRDYARQPERKRATPNFDAIKAA